MIGHRRLRRSDADLAFSCFDMGGLQSNCRCNSSYWLVSNKTEMNMAEADLTERQREALHEKLLSHMVRKMADDKKGIRGPGLELTDGDLGLLLRMTRARAAAVS